MTRKSTILLCVACVIAGVALGIGVGYPVGKKRATDEWTEYPNFMDHIFWNTLVKNRLILASRDGIAPNDARFMDENWELLDMNFFPESREQMVKYSKILDASNLYLTPDRKAQLKAFRRTTQSARR